LNKPSKDFIATFVMLKITNILILQKIRLNLVTTSVGKQ